MSREKIKRVTNRHSGDKTIITFVIFMALFGAIMIFDASVYKANTEFNDPFYFLKSQLVWLLVGSIPAILLYIWDYHKLLKVSLLALIGIIVLLILVLIAGETINGSSRWFQIGNLPPIQPAEFAKIVIIMYLASWLAKKEYKYKDFNTALKEGFLKNLLGFITILGVVAILILLEPDLGTTMVVCITAFIMFFLSGTDKAHTVGSIATVLLAIPLAVLAAILEPYRLSRVQTFLNLLLTGEVADAKGSGYQMQQILIGIGSGGFWGKGFGQSRQRFGYLVENTAFTDSIFAIVLEELGWWGGSLIVLAWLFFLWKGFQIAKESPDREGKLLATGIVSWLTVQAFLNMSANVGLIPLTGMPLPFLTYGGSSTIVTMCGIAILLNISRYTKKNE